MEGGLGVQVAGLFNGGNSMEGGLRVQVAELLNGGRSEHTSGRVVEWREV